LFLIRSTEIEIKLEVSHLRFDRQWWGRWVRGRRIIFGELAYFYTGKGKFSAFGTSIPLFVGSFLIVLAGLVFLFFPHFFTG